MIRITTYLHELCFTFWSLCKSNRWILLWSITSISNLGNIAAFPVLLTLWKSASSTPICFCCCCLLFVFAIFISVGISCAWGTSGVFVSVVALWVFQFLNFILCKTYHSTVPSTNEVSCLKTWYLLNLCELDRLIEGQQVMQAVETLQGLWSECKCYCHHQTSTSERTVWKHAPVWLPVNRTTRGLKAFVSVQGLIMLWDVSCGEIKMDEAKNSKHRLSESTSVCRVINALD